jgi:hypothetical protein
MEKGCFKMMEQKDGLEKLLYGTIRSRTEKDSFQKLKNVLSYVLRKIEINEDGFSTINIQIVAGSTNRYVLIDNGYIPR